MSDSIITVEDLSKSYIISHEKQEKYTALRDVISNQVKQLPHLFKKQKTRRSKEEFFALKDVNFEIKQGDRLGVIGRNGAGKSTLLKILSRITAPSTGRIHIKGRVASLLEVGTGFHPELTGRENIFLNGAILGMNRPEIRKKFDEIVEFAEVENFLDTPVKRYSSGMYVRLAFAVAAHLEPEVLIVDEVLAVGDAQFQKKCLGKMEDVSVNQGRTVLFVSHSMPTISSLCNLSMLLEKGRIKMFGATAETILGYYGSGMAVPTYYNANDYTRAPGDENVKLVEAGIYVSGKVAKAEIDITQNFSIEVVFEILKEEPSVNYFVVLEVVNGAGIIVFDATSSTYQEGIKGTYKISCIVPANLLNDGPYFVGLSIKSYGKNIESHLYEGSILSFHVKDPIYNVPTRLHINGLTTYSGKLPGTVRPIFEWEIEKMEDVALNH
jgi:lipopolysaccharide transport system ATP-binding protein